MNTPENTNLMQINSTNIGYMDTLNEYHKLSINNKIGSKINNLNLNIKENIMLRLKNTNIDEIWKALELKYEIFIMHKEKIILLADNFIAELSNQYISSHRGMHLYITADTISNCKKNIQEIKNTLKEFLIEDDIVEYLVLQYESSEKLNITFYEDSLNLDFNHLAVPFINDVDKYIDNFLNSSAPVLILQGEAGTGKTTFTKYILSKMKKKLKTKDECLNTLYSFDEHIFYSCEFFKKLIYDEYDVLILEDINQIIHKNQGEDDLNPINKFLSITDGLKKIIITTNIESKTQLNQALIRPGRCYDVLKFRKIKGIEIDNLCDSCAKDLDLQIESINISEFYAKCNNEQNADISKVTVGF